MPRREFHASKPERETAAAAKAAAQSAVRTRRTGGCCWSLAVVLVFLYYSSNRGDRSEISYGMFRQQLEVDKNIEKVDIEGAKVYGEFKKPPVDPDAKQNADGSYPQLKKKFVTTLPPMALSDPSLDRAAARAARAGLQGLGADRQHVRACWSCTC